MEAVLLGKLVDGWKANENILVFVHDRDASSMSVLKQKGWDLAESFDKNRIIINWKHSYQRLQWIPA
jgi:hypothetical protein